GLKGAALVLDPRAIEFRWARSFFLKTYPNRCSARRMLERWTRAAGAACRLYARVSSSVVRSGCSSITRCNNVPSTGEVHPPPFASGSRTPVVRCRRTQRSSVATPTSKRAATTAYDSVPASYARTASVRSAVGYGLGIHAIDHRTAINSSELWG